MAHYGGSAGEFAERVPVLVHEIAASVQCSGKIRIMARKADAISRTDDEKRGALTDSQML